MILLDTHALLWFYRGQPDLGASARRSVERAARHQQVYASTLSFFELGVQIARRRIKRVKDTADIRADLMADGLNEIAPDSQICIRAVHFVDALSDAFDTLIVATAMERNLTLITADERILAWKGALKRLDARK